MDIKEIAFGIIISLLFISLVIIFCIILIKIYVKKIKKYNKQLFENEINFQKILNTSILETQEQLLTSVSQDLHDDAGQQLTVINFQLENLKLDYPDKTNNLTPISKSVAKLSESLRQISHSLNPNWLEKNGLIDAIKSEVNRLKKNKLITVNLKIEIGEKNFINNEQIVLFRIFQEIINNCLKHSKATKIDINITTQKVFEMTIIDNGIGFDYNLEKEKSHSLGLENIIKRAKIINYHADIFSEKNNGCKITITELKN
jgi:signal transduction histidine kinase